jgi:hypothetical protein
MQDAATSELLFAAMETAGAPGVVMECAEAVGMAAIEEARITAADTDTDIRLTERAITVPVTTRVTTPEPQASTQAQAALVWAWAAPVSAMDGGERDSFPSNRVSCHG